ncbi:MAG: hypothetical protein KBT47_01245 [Armatimonadetes bacterium]|nr:hypothetical protein [Candidatus Hippobium faecium]
MAFKHKKRRVSDKKAMKFVFDGCNGKDTYNTPAEAKQAAQEKGDYQGIDLTYYKCKCCGKYHLTSEFFY